MGAAGGGAVSLFCPGGPVCVWFWSPTPFPGLAGGACTGAAGVGGFDFGFARTGAGAGGGETVVSRLGTGAGAGAGAGAGGGGGGGAVGAGAGAGAETGAEIGSGAAVCGAGVLVERSIGVRATTTGTDGDCRETTGRGAACSPAGAGTTVAGTIVCATTGGAATRTTWSPLLPTSVPGRPIAAVMAPSPAAAATIRDQPPLMLEPPSAEQRT